MQFPKLRNEIELIPVEVDGQRLLCFRDPRGFKPNPLFMPVAALHIIRFFDGIHSLTDIQAEWMRRTGEFLFSDDLQKLIQRLDEHLLLDSPKFQSVRQEIEQAFINSPIRRAAHMGECYPDNPATLRQRLEGFFTAQGNAGKPAQAASQNRLKGIIAPHIDLRVGGSCYSWAYKELAEQSMAETFIILGTSHYGPGDLFVPTRKDYQTPLGLAKTDQAFLDAFEKHYDHPLPADDTAHKMEHSIEFQVVFLQHLFQDQRAIEIVPILVTSFQEMVFKKSSPLENQAVSRFIGALKQTIGQHEKPICFVVGADLAHMGRKFGDPFAAQGMLQRIEREDLDMLRAVESVDAEGFFQSICQDEDRRKICGFPPIYTFLASVEASCGRLLKYEQWSEEATQSVVTYASMAFY